MSEKTTLLEAIVSVGRIAGGVAKQCRGEESLRKLLVQTKGENEANPRFLQDFKTLADVLIQQIVAKRLADQFPELAGRIYGEENNSFTNRLGETVQVRVEETEEQTAELLLKVLNGDEEAARLLANAAHSEASHDINTQISECLNLHIPVTDLAVWIDPIDSTTEYIQGGDDSDKKGQITLSGLQCVTVLIGVFDITTGIPIMGFINQPFYNESEGRCLWGVSYNDKKIFFNPEKDGSVDEREQIICTSSSEDEEVKRKLREGGYSTVEAAGAGYKLLMVILGHAQAYILSKPTTYKWDTCGPHALLSSLGGGIVDYRCALAAQSPHACQIKYYQNDTQCNDSVSINRWCNQGGIIAYRDQRILTKLLQLLSS